MFQSQKRRVVNNVNFFLSSKNDKSMLKIIGNKKQSWLPFSLKLVAFYSSGSKSPSCEHRREHSARFPMSGCLWRCLSCYADDSLLSVSVPFVFISSFHSFFLPSSPLLSLFRPSESIRMHVKEKEMGKQCMDNPQGTTETHTQYTLEYIYSLSHTDSI